MTAITFVGANAGVSGNNTSLTPTVHASVTTGDVVLMAAAIRNTAATVNTPTGWRIVASYGNVALLGYERAASGNPATTVTFAGGAAGDDTLAQIAVIRGASLAALTLLLTITNGSAQNITLPAADLPNRDGSIMIALGWKQDDFTSAATLASMTEIGEVSSTAGNDASMVWDYWIQTSRLASPAGPFVITGGAAAISKAIVIALPQKAVLTAVEQDVFPPRVLVTVTNLIIGDQASLYRSVGGERTLIRAGSTDAVTDVSFLRLDAELPFGVPVTYVAVVEDMELSTTATTYTLPGGLVALSDAISGDAAEAVIGAWPEKRFTREGSVLPAGGRNVAVLGTVGQFQGEIEFYTDSDTQRIGLEAVLRSATGGILQLRAPDASLYPDVDCFVAVLGFVEKRWSQDGTDPRRLWTVTVAQVDGWAPELEAVGFTYADLEAQYTGLTYATLATDYATYLALAQADLS